MSGVQLVRLARTSLTFSNSFACQRRLLHHLRQQNKPFPVLYGEVDVNSNEFHKNVEAYQSYIGKYEELLQKSQVMGGEKAIARHVKQHKKLLITERLKLLLDDEEEFLELSPIAGQAMEYGDVPRASVLTGIGKIHGKYCMIVANDGTVKGGTIFPITLKKQLRAQEIAQQNRLPCIYAVDSGGAFLPLQSEIFNPGGQAFYNEAVMSSLGIPQVAIVCGSCTAGGAYVPTMADEAVIVHRIGTIFLGGPPLVQAATGEIVTAEDLGGATLHCGVSGCTDYFAEDEVEGFRIGRDIVEGFNLPDHPAACREPEEPLYDMGDIHGLIPAQQNSAMDVRKILSRLLDGSRFNEFKAKFGTTLITGFGFVQGRLVGIVANDGEMSDSAAAKGAHFVQMCSERHIPLVFLHNIVSQGDVYGLTGGNFIRDHAKMMGAVNCAQVPKISIVIGDSVGPMSYLMCGRSSSPNFLFSWPNALVGMMEQSALVHSIVQEKFPEQTPEREAFYKKVEEKCAREMSAFYMSSRVLNDGIILPQDTRSVIGRCLDITSAYVGQQQTQYPIMRM